MKPINYMTKYLFSKMKNIDYKSILQLAIPFTLIGLVLFISKLFYPEGVSPKESTSRFTFAEIILTLLFVVIFFVLPVYIKLRRDRARHRKFHEQNDIPFANDKGECYCSSEERMDAFLNPNDPILNPRPTRKNELSEK